MEYDLLYAGRKSVACESVTAVGGSGTADLSGVGQQLDQVAAAAVTHRLRGLRQVPQRSGRLQQLSLQSGGVRLLHDDGGEPPCGSHSEHGSVCSHLLQ
jgi:hypothetical protein